MSTESASAICPAEATIEMPAGPPLYLHCAEPIGHDGDDHRGIAHEPGFEGRIVQWSNVGQARENAGAGDE